MRLDYLLGLALIAFISVGVIFAITTPPALARIDGPGKPLKPAPPEFAEGYYLVRYGPRAGQTCILRAELQEGGAMQLVWAGPTPYAGLGVLRGETLIVGLYIERREAVAVYEWDRAKGCWVGEWAAWNVEARGKESLEWLRPLK